MILILLFIPFFMMLLRKWQEYNFAGLETTYQYKYRETVIEVKIF